MVAIREECITGVTGGSAATAALGTSINTY